MFNIENIIDGKDPWGTPSLRGQQSHPKTLVVCQDSIDPTEVFSSLHSIVTYLINVGFNVVIFQKSSVIHCKREQSRGDRNATMG